MLNAPDVCKLTPDLSKKLLLLLERGNYLTVACEAVGITEKTYYNWLNWGAEEGRDVIYSQFRLKALAATAKSETKALEAWANAFDGDWRAAQKFLSIRFRNRWGEAKDEPQSLDTADDKSATPELDDLLATVGIPPADRESQEATGPEEPGGVRPDGLARAMEISPPPPGDQPEAR